MKASDFLMQIKSLGIKTIAGVPDSTLKQLCDEIHVSSYGFKHYTPANEGAAIGIAVGEYLACGNPACVYMQNSGIGNAVNPICSIANSDVYGIPMLLVIGWRGEPGKKDEPQHVFQGKVTCMQLDVLHIPYSIIGEETTEAELHHVMECAKSAFSESKQYAIVVKKGTFITDINFIWDNGNELLREEVLGEIVKTIPQNTCVVSTTGKISREIYEKSNEIYGNHNNIFMTVGGMGHASMIAYGIAARKPERQILCIEGDGAVLMHMGALPFIAAHAPINYYHVIINNLAHESVGGMPTDCQQLNFSEIAKAVGYKEVNEISDIKEIKGIGKDILQRKQGPVFYEIKVALTSRADLSRPAETAKENKERFMRFLNNLM